MESIVKDFMARNIGLVIANLQSRMILKLGRAGIRKQTGKIAFARSLDASFKVARRMHQ
jgi:SulP family sulfate permease